MQPLKLLAVLVFSLADVNAMRSGVCMTACVSMCSGEGKLQVKNALSISTPVDATLLTLLQEWLQWFLKWFQWFQLPAGLWVPDQLSALTLCRVNTQ